MNLLQNAFDWTLDLFLWIHFDLHGQVLFDLRKAILLENGGNKGEKRKERETEAK